MTELQEARFDWKGRTGPFSIDLGPGVFRPTQTSRVLADALDVRSDDVVIDVGCGSGVLSFVAARLGAGRVFGCDISAESVAIATANARMLGLSDVTEFRVGNLLDPVREIRADVLIGDVSGIPEPVAKLTGWFPGGPTGAELPVAMVESIGDCLKPGGRMYLPTGTIQDEKRVLAAARAVFGPHNMELVTEKEFPLPGPVVASKAVARMVSEGLLHLKKRGSRVLWRLAIWRCLRS